MDVCFVVRTHACVHALLCTCMERRVVGVFIFLCLAIGVFGKGSQLSPELTDLVSLASQLAPQRPISASGTLGLQVSTTPTQNHMAVGDLNSGPHTSVL